MKLGKGDTRQDMPSALCPAAPAASAPGQAGTETQGQGARVKHLK